MQSFLLHIGYHKTGTKWAQRFLFDSEAVGFFQPFDRCDDVGEWLVAPHDLDFDADATRDHFRIPPQADRPGLVPVLSHERLSGHPHSGGYDTGALADRLAAVFPGARILITVREQTCAIVSSYQQYARSGGTRPIRDYLEPPEMGRNRLPVFAFQHFEYDRAIRYYRTRFGPERVLVLAFEQFRRDPAEYIRRVADFAGARPAPGAIEELPYRTLVNASESFLSIHVRVRANRLFGRSRLHPAPWLDLPGLHARIHGNADALDRICPQRVHARLRRRTRAQTESVIGDRFAESNARLAELVDFDLGELGYRLPAQTGTTDRQRSGAAGRQRLGTANDPSPREAIGQGSPG